VLFTPHLAPMVRGILATCYARPADPGGFTTEDAMQLLHDRYDDEPFVVVSDDPPSTKAASGSNTAHVSVRVDPRTGWVVVLSALDNLIKGAAGQAVQCANLALGLPEPTGLPVVGVYP
jgi:N-acetyl-gamma-glutamyl-phosphate reductase